MVLKILYKKIPIYRPNIFGLNIFIILERKEKRSANVFKIGAKGKSVIDGHVETLAGTMDTRVTC